MNLIDTAQLVGVFSTIKFETIFPRNSETRSLQYSDIILYYYIRYTYADVIKSKDLHKLLATYTHYKQAYRAHSAAP